jgi:hypothetical protein
VRRRGKAAHVVAELSQDLLGAAAGHAGDGIQPVDRRLERASMLFEVDVLLCSRCGGRRRIVAVYPGGQRLRDLLDRLGLSQPPGLPPPQGFPDPDAAK